MRFERPEQLNAPFALPLELVDLRGLWFAIVTVKIRMGSFGRVLLRE